MNENREYKSDVFSMLMEDKRYALEVYNALNGSDYTDPEAVEMVRLEKGVSLSVRNDAAFIIDMNINFYEHQSTYSPNMPLRSMIYYVNTLEKWIRESGKDLFSRKLIRIPTPHFVVFYNGMEKRPEYEEMRLSQAFCHETEEPEIEVRCKVYNINPDNSRELKQRSEVLDGYTYFVEKVREYRANEDTREDAVKRAVEDCIREHVLEEFFRSRKDEVIKVTHLDFTWERREELIRKEEYEEGEAAGIRIGVKQGVKQGIEQCLKCLEMLKAGATKEELLREGFEESVIDRAASLMTR